jgi:hypothetical protein
VRLAATIASGRIPDDLDIVIDSMEGSDLMLWRDSPWIFGTPESVIYWVDSELAGHRQARTRFATRMLAHADPECQTGAVKAVADILSTWRSALRDFIPLLAERLDSSNGTVRAFALHLIIASGSAGTYADRLSAATTDETRLSQRGDLKINDFAVWGLAWSGDERALPGLLDRLSGDRLGFPTAAGHYGKSSYMTDPPALHEVLERLSGWADTLLPAVRDLLHRTDRLELRRTLAQTLEAWGPIAAPAVPELVDLGPLAMCHENLLRPYLTDTGEWERVEVAHALWRVTEDPADSIPILIQTVRPLSKGKATPVMRSAAKYLAEIGSLDAEGGSLLEAALSCDLRLSYFGGWRAFAEDERQRHHLRQALRLSPS